MYMTGGPATDSPRVAFLGVANRRVAASRIRGRETVLTCRGAYCYLISSRGEGKEQAQLPTLPWESKDRKNLLPSGRAPLEVALRSGRTAA